MAQAERHKTGFTLIELLVVMSILALLLTLALPRYFSSMDHSKEVTLQENLKTMRDTLDKFYADRGRYPDSLEQLVTERYLRNVPVDPITESTQTWITVAPENIEQGGIYDVRSGASGNTKNGTPYVEL